MRNILLNTFFVVVLVLTSSVISFWYSLETGDFVWFSRAGSIVTVFGILLTVKHNILSNSRDLESVVMEKNNYAKYAPKKGSDKYTEHENSAKGIIRDEYVGILITILGTIVWGYGDLLGEFFI